jgi:dimethylaniline monooxygenase (N-oxide forming)
VYTDEIGKDKHGLDIHSSMYQGLRTNLPKEIMHYPDHPFPDQETSYITAEEVLRYYQSYADTFDLGRFIKFEHHVVRVRPLSGNGDSAWEVVVKDLKSYEYQTLIYDAVFVCNGHYNAPLTPQYAGQDLFEGKQMHSHDYRCAAPFANESVLIIGAGPSGRDAVSDIQHVATTVTWSHHLENLPLAKFRDNVNRKPDVSHLTKDGAFFIDGSYQACSVIVYCTGYRYTFPFLSVDCGLTAVNNCVEPLYKHCLNIHHPTMAIIGLPNFICPNQMFDLQTRFCLQLMTGRQQPPSKAEMMEDYEKDKRVQLVERGMVRKKFHGLGVGYHEPYYESMAKVANIDPIAPVIGKMFEQAMANLLNDCVGFRNEVFRAIDNESFITISK